MGKSKNKGKGRSSRGKQNGNRGQASDAIVHYRGPVVPRGTPAALHIEVVRLVYYGAANSSAAGTLIGNFGNAPGATSDWSVYSGLYTQYRTLALRVKWIPNSMGFPSAGVSQIQAPIILWVYRGPSSAFSYPSSYATAYDNDGARVVNTSRTFTNTVRMDGTPDSDWQTTAAPTVTFQLGYFAAGLDVSVNYGAFFCDFLVQFRGRV